MHENCIDSYILHGRAMTLVAIRNAPVFADETPAAPPTDEDAPVTDYQIAWEALETARTLLQRSAEKQIGDDAKRSQLKMADVLVELGLLCMEESA